MGLSGKGNVTPDIKWVINQYYGRPQDVKDSPPNLRNLVASFSTYKWNGYPKTTVSVYYNWDNIDPAHVSQNSSLLLPP